MNPNDTLQIKERFENEMNMVLQHDMWEEICTEAHLVTNSNAWRELRQKVITICFRTTEIMSKMEPTHSDKCWRNCGTQTGNHTHISQACPKLKSFWDNVFEALRLVFKQSFMKDPKMAISGLIPLEEAKTTTFKYY